MIYMEIPSRKIFLSSSVIDVLVLSQVEQEVVGEVGQLPLMLRAMVAIGEPRAHHHAPRLGNKMGVGRLMSLHAPDIGGNK